MVLIGPVCYLVALTFILLLRKDSKPLQLRGIRVLSLLGCLEEVDSTCPLQVPIQSKLAQQQSTVSLDKSPTSSVALSIKSDNPEESSISPQTLTFTPENWNSTQTVTVTGVDDELKDGNQDYHVILGPAQSDDPLFNGPFQNL